MGTPCITSSDFITPYDPEEGPHSNRIITIYPGIPSIHPWQRSEVPSCALKTSSYCKNPINTLKIIENETLDIDKTTRLREYLNENMSVSFLLGESEKRAKQTIDFIRHLGSMFNYQFETWSHLHNSDSSEIMSLYEKDEALSIVSFFNVKSVAPIIDTRKVDGVIISLECVLKSTIEKKRTLEALDTIFILFTNHLENFTCIDGSEIATLQTFGEQTRERIAKSLRRKTMIKVSQAKKSPSKEEQRENTIRIEDSAIDSGTSTSNWTISSSSSTAYYYNTR
jgi:hypothetical protein